MERMESYQATLFHILDSSIDQDLIVAFSGGVDSALLVKTASTVAHKKGYTVHAVTFQTTLHPAKDEKLAKTLANDFGVDHHVLRLDELQHAGISNNPVNRCYLCKKYLFGKLREMADGLGIKLIMDGTNADDMHVYRPGIQALKELNIVSPLAQAGMTKTMVRSMAASYGLAVADKPSAPCLATRFPYGTQLSEEMMQKVAEAEDILKSMGFYNIRVRIHGAIARIEVDLKDLAILMQQRDYIVTYLKKFGWDYITVDLEGFQSGSMDKGITNSS